MVAASLILSLLATAQLPSPVGRDRFPIAVLLQSPSNAARYEQAGINLYVGLWKGPTEEDLAALRSAGMPVICDQNDVGLAHRSDPTIAGWLQQDEPDNAQPQGNGYGPCVPPSQVVENYKRWKANDPSRPVLLGLGQGVANDEWIGRGSGALLDDYKTYVNGGDIVSFDIYPVAGLPKPDSENYLYLVAKGVDRLRGWVPKAKPSWNCIECTGIDSGKKATPAQVKAEVWMSIVHGSTGLIYFVHEFKPRFKEAALLEDPPMLEAVTQINRQVQALARVLLSGKAVSGVTAVSADPATPVDVLSKRLDGATYVFSVCMRNAATAARFVVPGAGKSAKAEVLGESRSIPLANGAFSDRFEPYAVHLYRIVER